MNGFGKTVFVFGLNELLGKGSSDGKLLLIFFRLIGSYEIVRLGLICYDTKLTIQRRKLSKILSVVVE